jgi:hypothetical protein
LSGRLQSEHLEQLKGQIQGAESVILDLEDVKLIDRDAVCFLARCEASGIEVCECSPYIRDWIDREKSSQ